MVLFVAATAGMCVFVVTWALGLNPDVAGLIALTFVGIGALAQMARPRAGDEDGDG